MKIIKKIEEMRNIANLFKLKGEKIALVPTMGFLHNGHVSLIKKAKELADKVIVSIFVNQMQFGENEDFNVYPKNFEKDRDILKAEKTDILFAPTGDEIYPEGYQTYVSLKYLPNHLCGISRPSHFTGVSTIVSKLFNIVKPDTAIFGEKDFQQLLIIRKMNADLNFGVNIVGSPIIREDDGLAMSSRNFRLTESQRRSALSLFKALTCCRDMVKKGERNSCSLIKKAEEIICAFSETSIDYISICDIDRLENIEIIEKSALMALAVKIGSVRLIDNIILSL